MELNHLTAVSSVDGRYGNKTKALRNYYSEFALIKYRVKVEVAYFIALSKLPLPQLKEVEDSQLKALENLAHNFSEVDALKIKEIEKTTNHDVKAVEYFIKEEFERLGMEKFQEFIHFGLTSQDINNTSIPMMMRDCWIELLAPTLKKVMALLKADSDKWEKVPMLAKTHGQPASPTRLGKEVQVFVARLEKQLELLENIPFAAKFGGATGNMNAHYVAYPDQDWHVFADRFVSESLGLSRSFPTTQIEHYDHMAAQFDGLKRINTILLDYSKDIWQYVSMNYFKQKIKEGEIGSSAMPHKVNPIDFENAEGNLGIANALFEHLAAKLPISRLQRDLTDSTVLRVVGVPMAHTLIALDSLIKGIQKLELNETALKEDLNQNWAVVAEAIQTVLRREGFPKPYEALKALTRTHQAITQESIKEFINQLDVSENVREELQAITPFNYTGK